MHNLMCNFRYTSKSCWTLKSTVKKYVSKYIVSLEVATSTSMH